MRSTSLRPHDEPGSSSSSSDASNINESPLSLEAHRDYKRPTYLDQGSLLSHQQSSSMTSSQTLYIPIASPPTPAPSPGPVTDSYHQHHQFQVIPFPPLSMMNTQNLAIRRQFITSVLSSCTPFELLFISQAINLLLKRDFLYSLPTELALYTLTFIDEPKTLTRASQVSKHWRTIARDESVWKRMCQIHGFDDWHLDGILIQQSRKRLGTKSKTAPGGGNNGTEENINDIDTEGRRQMDQLLKGDLTSDRTSKRRRSKAEITKHDRDILFSYRRHFRTSFIIHTNWRKGGTLLRSHRLPIVSPDNGTVTSLALDSDWVIVGLANSKIQVFSARTGVLTRTLIGHELGVWGLCLVSSGGYKLADPKKSRAERKKTQTRSSGKAEGFDPSSKKQKKTRGPSTQDAGASSSQPSIRTLRAGVAGIDLHSKHADRGGMHVMPSESLDFLVSPAMRIALGLDPLTDSEREDSGGDSHHEDHFGSELKAKSAWDEDSTGRHHHAQRGGTATSEEEDQPGIGGGPGRTPDKPSSMCFASQGWGQPNSLVVSGGCDKVVRVWDAESGHCIYVLHGHTSTIRSLRVLHNRPIAVTSSRDSTLRVWDIQRGRCLRVLEGHHQSVRCLDVCGNRVVSGSYDNTCRLWDVDTGECIFVLQGHLHQIYCVAFDGVRIASGGLDTTVRVWDAETGECLALLQGHTALVCQLQLSPTILATGGSDGRVITFCLDTYTALQRIAAHDSSVISLQFDKDFLVTGGNDGRVKVFETQTGNFVRELGEPGECIWKVAFMKYTCAVMCKRAGKTVVEIWSLLGNGKGGRRQRFEEARGALC
ncbi:WD40 repeat-like protein [Phlegmacium glaucopus]|nr:WD40 repeat-like protein [Phlegmacium glaucopus]